MIGICNNNSSYINSKTVTQNALQASTKEKAIKSKFKKTFNNLMVTVEDKINVRYLLT